MKSAIRPCRCGHTPILVHSKYGDTRMMRLTCVCGRKGAALMYTKPKDFDRMLQAALDGWNLGG